MLKNARSVVIAGGSHAIIWTHDHEVNQALLDFICHPGRAAEQTGRPTAARTRRLTLRRP